MSEDELFELLSSDGMIASAQFLLVMILSGWFQKMNGKLHLVNRVMIRYRV